ncbi:MAG: hypothetical protein QOF42_2436, partial [Gammaproteobacteria bacterium]|nr:hypothetical protein [Gammaproteobacteria bacterium]
AAGLPVLMHGNTDEAHRFGVDASVDIMAHGLWNWNTQHTTTTEPTPDIRKILDDELAHNVGWQPTIQVLYGIKDLFNTSYLADPRLARVLPTNLLNWYRSPQGQWFHDVLAQDFKLPADADPGELGRRVEEGIGTPTDRVKHEVAYLVARHARILFGTDTPSAPTYANPPGLNGWMEMQRLIEAGETPAQIFKSATLTNAQALKLDKDIGTVQIGKRANLLLLRQDPARTIDAYADIEKVILNGRVLDPSELAANGAR